jgi:ADP-ribosyl-[dinitrogen reductase] hydrolase
MNKATACILGGAIGDAMGMPYEIFIGSCRSLKDIKEMVYKQRKSLKDIPHKYVVGGPFNLQAGEWTDDTSQMLCLTDSILEHKTVDIADLMRKIRKWWFNGYNSCNGTPLGLGGNTAKALYSFDEDDPYKCVGGTNPEKDAGNGSLMRLAPVPVYWHKDINEAIMMARLQTKVTHNVIEAQDGSALMTYIIWLALNGKDKDTIFGMLEKCPTLYDVNVIELTKPNAKWRTATEDDILTLPGRCLWTLEAALWCIYNTNNFESAVMKAVRLGGDSDTVGSVTGQIAGALYGMDSIPKDWINNLYHKDTILQKANNLYLANM